MPWAPLPCCSGRWSWDCWLPCQPHSKCHSSRNSGGWGVGHANVWLHWGPAKHLLSAGASCLAPPCGLMPVLLVSAAAISTCLCRWPLDYAKDAAFAGQVPCLAVPSFSQPQPYPLVIMQQATPAQGGGWMVHIFLDAAEVLAMQQAVAAQGGL